MSTHAALYNAKTNRAIYIHFDGYWNGVGLTLCQSWRDPSLVDQLFAVGLKDDLRILGNDLATTPGLGDLSPTIGDREISLYDVREGEYGHIFNHVYVWDGAFWVVVK